ncbi:hypothetical protein SynMINOS11_02233 [Synechococcus sp. Minos11]|nr:hypothetical protein SynMINOS11_02233 [Synechococcus sp. Minos11]
MPPQTTRQKNGAPLISNSNPPDQPALSDSPCATMGSTAAA